MRAAEPAWALPCGSAPKVKLLLGKFCLCGVSGVWNQGCLELQGIPEQSLVVWWFKMNKGREHMVQAI